MRRAPSSDGGATAKVILLVATLIVVTTGPYVFAWLSAPPSVVYTGLMFDVPDHAQYWSWVTASRRSLFISNTMTPEANPAVFLNPQMWALAQVQTAFDLSFPALFQIWRLAALALFLPALFAFLRVMVPEPDHRRAALWVGLFGAGLGWIWVVLKYGLGLSEVPFPQDLYTVEPNTFFAMLSYPHLLLAQGLILAAMAGAWRAHGTGRWPAYVLAAAAAGALSATHTYDLITVFAVLGVYGSLEWARRRVIPWRLLGVGILMGLASAPMAVYYQVLTSTDPLWQEVLGQYGNAGVWTPRHIHLVVLMGVPLLLAVVGLVPRTGWTDRRRFLAVWTVVGLGLVYLPVVYQVKLLSAWQFPIAILAVYAWNERVVPAWPSRLSPTLATLGLIAFVSLTNVYLYAWRFIELRRHTSPYFLHEDQVAAMRWLASHSDASDVVLAPASLGQFVPNYGETRAYLAHWAMTTRFFERRAHVEQFFTLGDIDEWRHQLLDAGGVTLVMRSSWPAAIDTMFDPAGSAGYTLVFSRPEAQLYRVSAAARPHARVRDR